MFSSDMTDSLQLSTIFRFMESDYHEAVVKRALNSRDKVSKEAQGSLNSAINKTVKVPQFPNYPAKAPTPFLIKPILKATMRSDMLTAVVLKAWAESQDTLSDVVVKHLENLAMPVEYPDCAKNRFRSTWFSDTWLRETNKILERYDDFDHNDIALMLCYASGKIPSGETKDDILSQGLEYLRSLPPTSAELERIPDFIEELNAIREKKEEQRGLAVALDDAIAGVLNNFSAEMAFFQQDVAFWSANKLSPDADVAKALKMTEELQSLLIEYQPIYGIAPVLTEERIRRQKRAKLEPRILPILDHIDQLMTGGHGPDDDFPSGIDNFDEATGAEADPPDQAGKVVNGSSFPGAGGQKTNGKIDEQPLEVPDDVKSGIENGPTFSEAEYISLQSENQRLYDRVESLQKQLHKSQEESENHQKEAKYWRQCYEDVISKQPPATAGEDEDLSIESVHDAVELAKQQFGHRLIFALNAKSQVRNNPFNDPKVLYKAFEWMSTTLYDSLIGKTSVTDLDLSIRQACNGCISRGKTI
ncbi:MAG: hypothetical protein OXN20_06055 [Gemmatimonadota bacterium]|nr:hypothetical protein [Gemmatimonadota bacterium]